MAFPFTESRAYELEEVLKKERDSLPHRVRDHRHEHELELDMAKAYVCDECQQKGQNWVFSCKQCNFDLHPTCAQESTDVNIWDIYTSNILTTMMYAFMYIVSNRSSANVALEKKYF